MKTILVACIPHMPPDTRRLPSHRWKKQSPRDGSQYVVSFRFLLLMANMNMITSLVCSLGFHLLRAAYHRPVLFERKIRPQACPDGLCATVEIRYCHNRKTKIGSNGFPGCVATIHDGSWLLLPFVRCNAGENAIKQFP